MVSNISVLIPNYNGEKFLVEALESVLAQTQLPHEIIVVDDCSTDGSWEILKGYAERDSRIRILRNEENKGIYYTRNRLFREIPEGVNYIAIFDSDDVMEVERLRKQSEYLDTHNEISILGAHLVLIDEEGRDIAQRTYSEVHADISRSLLVRNSVAQPAVMMRKEVVSKVGFYDESLARVGDLDYWARAVLAGCAFATFPGVLLKYRIHKKEGRFARDKEHLRCALTVRVRYIRFRQFFSFRALISIGVYAVATLLPTLWLQYLAQNVHRITPSKAL